MRGPSALLRLVPFHGRRCFIVFAFSSFSKRFGDFYHIRSLIPEHFYHLEKKPCATGGPSLSLSLQPLAREETFWVFGGPVVSVAATGLCHPGLIKATDDTQMKAWQWVRRWGPRVAARWSRPRGGFCPSPGLRLPLHGTKSSSSRQWGSRRYSRACQDLTRSVLRSALVGGGRAPTDGRAKGGPGTE